MAISNFIEKVCVQTAVLWSFQGSDGYGGMSFSTPVEIKCRWEEKANLLEDKNGKQFTSKAEILIPQIYLFKEQDFLYLGSLEDVANAANPLTVEKAFEVKVKESIPMIFSTTVFVTKAYL
jgi:hypothetical protein